MPGGALLFESRFESGNLRRAVHVAANEYDLLLSWDHGTRGNTQWFFFSVRGARAGETYIFNIVNFCKPQVRAAWQAKAAAAACRSPRLPRAPHAAHPACRVLGSRCISTGCSR